MRSIGMDAHRDFCEVAIVEDGEVRSAGRIATSPESLGARRAALVRQRTRATNEIHAVIMRCLLGRPPASDLFGKKGRAWLAAQQLPVTEEETVAGCLRQVDFLGSEIAAIDAKLAEFALASTDVKRLMTIPGVDVACACTDAAATASLGRSSVLTWPVPWSRRRTIRLPTSSM